MSDLYFDYWKQFLEYAKKSNLHRNFTRRNQGRFYYGFSLGIGNNDICFMAKKRDKVIGCEIYLKGVNAKYVFNKLESKKDEIEKELSLKLNWQKLPHANDSRIIIFTDENISEKVNWDNQFKWLIKNGEKFQHVFYKHIELILS